MTTYCIEVYKVEVSNLYIAEEFPLTSDFIAFQQQSELF